MHLLGALAKPRSTLLIWHLHEYLEKRPAMRVLLRGVLARCSLIVAVSRSIAADARKALPHGPPLAVIHNAVDTDVFTPHGPALDLAELSGLPPPPTGAMRVGLVATFAHWKGHEVFLQAAASAAGNHRFYVVGGPIYATGGSQWSLDDLRARAGALGVADRVGFTGFVKDVPAAMRGLDVVVHASTAPEPFGLAILQAMACGRPVIVTAVGGACELIAPEENALAVSAGNSTELLRAIERLAGEPALRLRLARAGRANVEHHFSRACMATKVIGLYDDLQERCR
jgi:glycosyltransferase involved in cell wall biosynthesis